MSPAPWNEEGSSTPHSNEPDSETDEDNSGQAHPDPRQLLLASTGRVRMFVGLLWDVGLSLLGYYGLRLLGSTEWVALLGGAAVAALRVVWVAVRDRRLNAFALVMVMVFGLGVLFAVVGGDVRFLLLKESATTGVVGLTFLVTTALRYPLTLAALQSWQPHNAEALADMYDKWPAARHGFRLSALVWGIGLLAEALLRIPLVYLLTVDVMVAVSEAMLVGTLVGLVGWNGWYIRRTIHRLRTE
ncbi:VC0807 family protein [Actinopolyspora mortivallis]|uniref:VC0807 family protein n=1 Tax=Actinopolyspora mortivallis TaxID=33906 RepID=UPI0003671B77|nr:VC0807 family protein [Actinopolyspora mortivallis]